MDWIKTITTSRDKDRGLWVGPRSMVDMCDLVKLHYYHPLTKGSNSIKKELPATLHESKYIRGYYSKPIYGADGGVVSLNFRDWTWVHFDKQGEVIGPYKILPPIFENVDTENLDLLMGSEELADGGAAMTAYAKMQFTEMSRAEREALFSDLLKYCELDTLAMVMLYQHWREALAERLHQAA